MFYKEILDRIDDWSDEKKDEFGKHVDNHKPQAMFIGCADARVPVHLITGTDIGELFVYRNIANQTRQMDMGFSSALQYAVEVLGVEDIIVCGHQNCGGCGAALGPFVPDMVEAWIEPIRTLARLHEDELASLGERERLDSFVEINAEEQLRSLATHPVVRHAWGRGQTLRLHAWVYQLSNGKVNQVGSVFGGEVVKAS